MTLAEAGARKVYCVDLPKQPGEEWTKVRDAVPEGAFEYVSQDVTDQASAFPPSARRFAGVTNEVNDARRKRCGRSGR